MILPLNLSSNELIIPQKKPIISEDIVKISKVKNYLIPLKKPQIKEKKEVKISKILENNTKKKVNGIIVPVSKPIIVKKDKLFAQKKSKYFSEKDYRIAKEAIKLMEKRNWFEAEKIAKKAKNKSIYNFIQWNHLITTGNRATFFDYKNFIKRNKDYPRMGRVKYLAEHKLSTDVMSPKAIINYFENEKPLSGFGEMILGESYILTGEKIKGINFENP